MSSERQTGAAVLMILALITTGCSDPPAVSESVLERTTTEEAVIDLERRSAGALVARVPPAFFDNTARPVLGRPFLARDFTPSPSVCILSRPLWERLGAGSTDAPVEMNGSRYEVIGVMPGDFDIPEGVDVWIPAATGEP